jgi:hypothetical protein
VAGEIYCDHDYIEQKNRGPMAPVGETLDNALDNRRKWRAQELQHAS